LHCGTPSANNDDDLRARFLRLISLERRLSNSPDDGRRGGIAPINIEDELKKSYLDYAMSVIVSRALPDARDGLKPVHRRILFSMNEQGHTPDRSYVKSARIVVT